MNSGNALAPDLRRWIEAAVGNTLTQHALNGLVGLCHSMAAAALRRKVAPVMLTTGVHGTNYRDLAYDCIAELFEQGEDGGLMQIRAYFQGVDRDGASDDQLLMHLRRLVFTKVNHGIVRFHSEADPELGKILRNIRLSVQALHNFTVVERFGDAYLLPAFSPSLEHLPPLDREELEAGLRGEARPHDHVPAMLAHLSRFLLSQSGKSRIVPLTSVALAIKSLYLTQGAPEPGRDPGEDPFTVSDTLSLVRTACREVLGRMAVEYVGSGKVEREMFLKYTEVIEKNVSLRFSGGDMDGRSLYASLQAMIPNLSESEYRSRHRARLEYLARLAYKRSVEMLRADA